MEWAKKDDGRRVDEWVLSGVVVNQSKMQFSGMLSQKVF